MAVKINPDIFQYVGKNSEDDDEILKLAFQQDKEILRYASESLRKTIFLNINQLLHNNPELIHSHSIFRKLSFTIWFIYTYVNNCSSTVFFSYSVKTLAQ